MAFKIKFLSLMRLLIGAAYSGATLTRNQPDGEVGGVKNTLCMDWSAFSDIEVPFASKEDCLPPASEECLLLLFFFMECELLIRSLSVLPFLSLVDGDLTGELKWAAVA